MTPFPGYQLLRAHRASRADPRIVRDERLPIEQRIDPDGPRVSPRGLSAPRRQDQGSGLWCHRRARAVWRRRARHLQHVRLAEECRSIGWPLQCRLRRVRALSPSRHLRWHPAADREYAVPALRGVSHVLRHTEPAAAPTPPTPSRAAGEAGHHWVLTDQDVHLALRTKRSGGGVRPHRRLGRSGISCFVIERHPGLHR